MDKEMELLQGLRTEVEDLGFRDEGKLDACRRRTEMLARRIFGEGNKYIEDLKKIRFHPKVYLGEMTDEDYRPSWNSGKAELLNLVNTMIEEHSIFGSHTEGVAEGDAAHAEALMEQSVYGHSELVKQNPQAAIQQIFTLFEDRLRKRIGAGPDLYGESLINAAFGNKGVLAYGGTRAEQVGIRNLLSGAYATFRNPRMHRLMEDDEKTVRAIITLVDLLIKIVDEAKPSS